MNHREIEINCQRIAYYESTGTGQPVLFVHGNSMSGLSFEKQLKSTLGGKYRLVALDLPGHGESGPAQDSESGYTLPGYAAVVSAFARRLAIDDALLVGWSLGGHVILEASGLLPDSAGLMICGTPPVGKPVAADAFIPNPLVPLIFKSDLSDEEIVAVTAGFFKPGSRTPEFFIDDMRRTDGRAREALGVSVGEGNYTDEVVVVANLNKPLAIVHSEYESVANLSYLKNLRIPTLWRGEIQIIPDAGHTPQWEQPERFNSLLAEFITECTTCCHEELPWARC
jgi:pimeloyl-ACP methyl ester carboxylesterase